jgi:hypothetical protein
LVRFELVRSLLYAASMDVNSLPALAAHETAVGRDLALLNLPPANWLASVSAPDGSDALDVAIVGAGMLGIAACSSNSSSIKRANWFRVDYVGLLQIAFRINKKGAHPMSCAPFLMSAVSL